MHVPQPGEWSHTFEWHGSNRSKLGHMTKKARQFQRLRVIPTQMYYNVENVRTSDDAVVLRPTH